MKPAALFEQLQEQRRTVDFQSYDMAVQQLFTMLETDQIDIAPAYQRQFRWTPLQCSELIESVMLGIPVPSLYMATNEDGSWELVAGVQRLSALAMFAGGRKLQDKLKIKQALRLSQELQKLDTFRGLHFEELPESIQLQFTLRSLKVITLTDKSDSVVRFDLFERLNRGGVALTEQEIRNCVFRGKFADFVDELADNSDFKTVVRLAGKQNNDGTGEECVLRFFAFLNRYTEFDHSVKDFLNNYMRDSSKKFEYKSGRKIFESVFEKLAQLFPAGLVRPSLSRKAGTTSLVLYEGVVVGAALAYSHSGKIDGKKLNAWLPSPTLKKFTTGATNSASAVAGRIEFCRDRFLGKL